MSKQENSALAFSGFCVKRLCAKWDVLLLAYPNQKSHSTKNKSQCDSNEGDLPDFQRAGPAVLGADTAVLSLLQLTQVVSAHCKKTMDTAEEVPGI